MAILKHLIIFRGVRRFTQASLAEHIGSTISLDAPKGSCRRRLVTANKPKASAIDNFLNDKQEGARRKSDLAAYFRRMLNSEFRRDDWDSQAPYKSLAREIWRGMKNPHMVSRDWLRRRKERFCGVGEPFPDDEHPFVDELEEGSMEDQFFQRVHQILSQEARV